MSFAARSSYFSNNLIKDNVLLLKHTVMFQDLMLAHRELFQTSHCDFSSTVFCLTIIWTYHQQSQCSFNWFSV